ncbi:MAG: response regulator [Candidatus Omnitrophota bacterium]
MKKILIVDDSPFIRMVLKNIVEKTIPDSQVIEADSGTTALKQFKKAIPDLVLLDIIMPEGENEGVDVLKRIKDAVPEAKIIMITAVGHDAMINRCKELGVEDYIVKPFDDAQIEQVLNKYIKRE